MSVIRKFRIGKYEDGSLYIERCVYPRFRADIKFENIINFDEMDEVTLKHNLRDARMFLRSFNFKPLQNHSKNSKLVKNIRQKLQ
ncbi:MAG: hypothetical protein IJ180_00555 [Bacteroidales bacterium]|nr:hypothetical protein [Bacteroidales bacterium]